MAPTSVFVLSSVAIVLTLLWMAVHGLGLYFYSTRGKGREGASKLARAAWLVSFGSGFTGPLVILGNLVSLIMGVVALIRASSQQDASTTRIAAKTTIVASLIIELMAVLMIGWVVLWTYFMH